MKHFDDWFDIYERDGGELMLYNTIDMRSAFQAGAGAANGVLREALERIADSHVESRHFMPGVMRDIAKQALQQAGGGE